MTPRRAKCVVCQRESELWICEPCARSLHGVVEQGVIPRIVWAARRARAFERKRIKNDYRKQWEKSHAK